MTIFIKVKVKHSLGMSVFFLQNKLRWHTNIVLSIIKTVFGTEIVLGTDLINFI